MLGRAIIINLDNNEPAAATVVGTIASGFSGVQRTARHLGGIKRRHEELQVRVCHVFQLQLRRLRLRLGLPAPIAVPVRLADFEFFFFIFGGRSKQTNA